MPAFPISRCFATLALAIPFLSVGHAQLDQHALAVGYFGNDAPWYEENIPFLEIDDAAIQDTYYYRWKLFRSHLRQIGAQSGDRGVLTVTEFLPDVSWARHPDTDLNDSSAFHIREGRWLRNPAIIASLIDHLYAGGGNDRHFSEWVAAATLDFVRVTGDAAPALRNLPAMRQTWELWDDHRDFSRNLYWIEPLLDATEYTVGSIDASGAGFSEHPSTDQNRNGFTQGYAFRPSINSYQYANALAISNFAGRAGQPEVARSFQERAQQLQRAVLNQLWNPELKHFTDVYQRSTPTVKAGDFIRGRELVGYTPWMFGLVPIPAGTFSTNYNTAWQHLLQPTQLAGAHGLRTVEPSYPRYLTQYRFDAAMGRPECQWNGPSWPFQTSQTLTGLANLLQQAPGSTAVTSDTYVTLLRQYTAQHRLTNGALDIQEDYNPDTGLPIVGLLRSHHYNHSTYNDLILSGLVGIQPRDDDTLQLTPLLPLANGSRTHLNYFALQSVRYHDRDLTIRYDADGSRYGKGRGLTVECDGQTIFGPTPLTEAHRTVVVALCAKRDQAPQSRLAADLAVNVFEHAPSTYERAPIAIASSTAAGHDPYQAIDGRLWFFPEIPNGWSPERNDATPAFTLQLPAAASVSLVQLAFFDDGQQIRAPRRVAVAVQHDGQWQELAATAGILPNGITAVSLPQAALGQAFRLRITPAPASTFRLVEVEMFDRSTHERPGTSLAVSALTP